MRQLARALSALLLGGCVAAADPGRGLEVRSLELPVSLRGPHPAIGDLELLAALRLSGGPEVGGLSSLLLRGDDLLLLSDRARLFQAHREEDADGRLKDLSGWAEVRLPASLQGGDTESMTRLGDGSIAVAAENRRQLYRLSADGRSALKPIAIPASLKDMPPNQGIEALATLRDGALIAFSEGLPAGPGRLAGARFDGRGSTPLALQVAPGFRPTGADRVDDWLFILERRLSLLGGLEARVTVYDCRQLRPASGSVIEARELARLGAGSLSENFEGIAARRAADGRYLIYLVSDDNFLPIQQTLLLQLAWAPPS